MPTHKYRAWPLAWFLAVCLCLAAACSGNDEDDCDGRDPAAGDQCPSDGDADDDDANDDADDDTDDDTGDDDVDDDADDDADDDVDDDADDDWTQDPLYPEPVWMKISSGTYNMGCSPGDEGCNPDENPLHEINVSEFMITDAEITQYQFHREMGFNPSHFKPASGYDECPDCPVEQVSWYEAKEFCLAQGGRLPTEAEWEYAARAGTTTKFYCGDDWDCLDEIAWYWDNAGDQTHAVKSKDDNEFGVSDMLGNVWEWVNDWYLSEYYENSPLNDPPGATDGEFKVLRGGSWKYDPDAYMTASDRYLHIPESKYNFVGFRCIRQ